MTLSLSAVTLNSADPARTASFWAAALGGTAVDGGNGYVHVRGADVLLIVQPAQGRRAPEGSDVHLDLRADRPADEVRRLIDLGASHLADRSDSHGSWTVLLDPDGREFCVA
jgi:catechol 2,3-dioxygenase-like lactoylglutathione lyase family enzyme